MEVCYYIIVASLLIDPQKPRLYIFMQLVFGLC